MSVTGVVPRYLEEIKPTVSAEENIKDLNGFNSFDDIPEDEPFIFFVEIPLLEAGFATGNRKIDYIKNPNIHINLNEMIARCKKCKQERLIKSLKKNATILKP